MVTAASTNTGKQNAVTLSTLANSFVTGGGKTGAAANQLDLSSASNAIACLNNGLTDTTGITYKMSPAVADPADFTEAGTGLAGSSIVFTYVPPGGTP